MQAERKSLTRNRIAFALATVGLLSFAANSLLAANVAEYRADQVRIKEAKLTEDGKVAITFLAMPETLYYCPGANSRKTKKRIELTFVRAWFKRKPKVTYPAKQGKNGDKAFRVIVVDANDKPIFLKSGKKLVQIFPPSPKDIASDETGSRPTGEAIPWRAYSSAKLKELRDQNKPILVFCRADWDVTGTILEQTLFADQRVIRAIKEQKHIPLRADFTKISEEVDRFLRQLGASPGEATIVVFHGPNSEEPIVLQMKDAQHFISVENLLAAMKPQHVKE